MRVLLAAAPPGGGHTPTIPLGLLYVATAVEQAGHEVVVVDLGFSRDPISSLTEEARCRPDVIGLSLRNLAESQALSGVYETYRGLVQAGQRSAPVVAGGAGFSICAQKLLTVIGADYGVIGPGEMALTDLLAQLGAGREGPSLRRGVRGPWTDVTAIRSRHWDRYGRYYSLTGRPVPVRTSRGCSHSCRYCSYPQLDGSGIDCRNPADAAAEMISLSTQAGDNGLFVVDSVFNGSPDHARAVLNELQSSVGRIAPWQCCLNPAGVTVGFARALAGAGCRSCDLGADSLSDPVLSALGKGFSAADAVCAATALKQAGVDYRLFLMFGGPGETAATIDETVRTVSRLSPHAVNAFIGVRLYPGTALADDLRQDHDYLVPSPRAFYLSEAARDRLSELVADQPPGWVFSNTTLLDQRVEGV